MLKDMFFDKTYIKFYITDLQRVKYKQLFSPKIELPLDVTLCACRERLMILCPFQKNNELLDNEKCTERTNTFLIF